MCCIVTGRLLTSNSYFIYCSFARELFQHWNKKMFCYLSFINCVQNIFPSSPGVSVSFSYSVFDPFFFTNTKWQVVNITWNDFKKISRQIVTRSSLSRQHSYLLVSLAAIPIPADQRPASYTGHLATVYRSGWWSSVFVFPACPPHPATRRLWSQAVWVPSSWRHHDPLMIYSCPSLPLTGPLRPTVTWSPRVIYSSLITWPPSTNGQCGVYVRL